MKQPNPIEIKKNASPENFHEVIQQTWLQINAQEGAPKIQQFKTNTALLDTLAQDSNLLYLIFDNASFEFVFIGKNVQEFTGYSAEEIGKRPLLFIFKTLRFEHLLFFAKVAEMSRLQKKLCPDSMLADHYTFSAVGLTFRHRDGRLVKTMYRAYALEGNEKDPVALQLFELRNVTHLLKLDGFWFRGAAGNPAKFLYCYFSNDKKRPHSTDLLSEREMEVLRLVAEGLPSTEIAERLSISINTVEKHRKNMIARLGAKDAVALTEICKRVGIL